MTEKEYRQMEGISRSELWKLMESPEKAKWAWEHPEEPTPALLFGQAAHKMMLEPGNWHDEFVVAPSVDRRTKEGKAAWLEFSETVGDRAVISGEDFTKVLQMVEQAGKTPFLLKLLEGPREMPVTWTDELTGEPCKARLDCVTKIAGRTVIVDYKTTADASTDAFMRTAVKYGYDFQAAMYCEGYKAATGEDALFAFIAQEKTEPYAVNILQADEVFMRRGRDIFRELLGVYHECKKTDNWYGYLGPYNTVNNLALPVWLAKEVE